MIVLLVFQTVHEKKEIHVYRSGVLCKNVLEAVGGLTLSYKFFFIFLHKRKGDFPLGFNFMRGRNISS